MKKILAVAAILLLALASLQIVVSTETEYMQDSGYALTDNSISSNLSASDDESDKKTVQTVSFSSGDLLVKNTLGYFLGRSRTTLAHSYPLFINDGESVMTLNDNAQLITQDLAMLPAFQGMYLSDGSTFTADKEQADAETFILLSLDNGLYLNADTTTVATALGDVSIPVNSIISLSETQIKWYALSDGIFAFESTAAITEHTTITIGEKTYNYYKLLEALNLLQKEQGKKNPEEIELPDSVIIPEEGQKLPGIPDQGTENQTPPDASQAQSQKPSGGTSSETGSDGASSGNPSGSISGSTSGGTSDSVSGSTSDSASDSTSNSTSDSASDSTSDSAPSSGTPGEPSGPRPDPDYQKPVVELGSFTMDIYGMSSSITIEDPAYRIYKSVKVEAYIGNQLHMRKSFKRTTENFTLTPLRPGQTYTIKGWYEYYNEYGVRVKEEFYSENYTTLGLENLAPLEVNIEQNGYYSNHVSFNNIKIVNKEDDGVDLTAKYINKAEFKADTYRFNLSFLELNKFKKSAKEDITATLVSSAILPSAKEYDYTFKLYDRFDNELPMVNEISGKTRTCKVVPTAQLTITSNKVADTRLAVQINNEDNASMENTTLRIYDKDGNPVSATLYGQTVAQHEFEIKSENTTLRFIDLDEKTVYMMQVISDYDIDDDNGWYRDETIGTAKLITLPVSSLGYLFMTNKAVNTAQTTSDFTVKLDTLRTDETLMYLLSELEFIVMQGDTVVDTKTITGDTNGKALHAMKTGGNYNGDGYKIVQGELQYTIKQLTSKTEYQIVVNAYVQLGTKKIATTASYPVKTFKTLREVPTASVKNVYTTLTSFELFNTFVADPDDAVLKNINVVVRSSVGVVVGVYEIAPDTMQERMLFSGLQPNEEYTVGFYVQEINLGYEKYTVQNNYKLAYECKVQTIESIVGSIALDKMQAIDSATGLPMGENLLTGVPLTKQRLHYQTGETVNDNNYRLTDYIPVTSGNTYGMANCMYPAANDGWVSYALYDENKVQVRYANDQLARGTVKIPEGVAYIRIGMLPAIIDRAYFALVDTAAQKSAMRAQMNVMVHDKNNNVTDNEYRVLVFKNDKRVNKVVNAFTPGTPDLQKVIQDVKNSGSYQPDTYRFELWVSAYGYDILLDTTEFTAEEPIYVVRNEWELAQMAADPDGKYMVVADIAPTDLRNTGYVGGRAPFNGTLDFNGHSFTPPPIGANSTYIRMFESIGKTGVVENLVYNASETFNNQYYSVLEQPLIAGSNSGTIRNVQMNLKGTEVPNYTGAGSLFARRILMVATNTRTGVIENFAFDMGGDFHQDYATGFVARANYGTVRNGTVFGGDLYVYGNDVAGMVVGANYSGAKVQNVLTKGNVYIMPTVPETRIPYIKMGIGSQGDTGATQRIISTGDVLRKAEDGTTQYLLEQAPVGKSPNTQSAHYYYSQQKYTGLRNMKISKQALHNLDWYQSVLIDKGTAFDFAPVASGFYPQPHMDACMPPQKYLALPEMTPDDITKLETAVVVDQQRDFAVVKFAFSNNGEYPITDIQVEYLKTTIMAQENKDGISTVTARVEPSKTGITKYVSSYDVVQFTRETDIPGHAVTEPLEKGTITVGAEFYKAVSTPLDWANINNDVTQNYRLQNDLSLESLPAKEAILFKNSNVFTGNLDGDGHTVTNLNLDNKYGYVINNFSGTIKNITFDNVRNLVQTATYAGIIYNLVGGTADGVCVKNTVIGGIYFSAPLVAYASNAIVRNCASIDNTILMQSSTYQARVGGLVANATYTSFENCFVRNISIDTNAFSSVFAGGMVGIFNESQAENCYATGMIKTVAEYAGGFIGNMTGGGAKATNCWADVDVSAVGSGLGGFVGSNNTRNYYGTLALGNVNMAGSGDATYMGRFSSTNSYLLEENGSETFGFEGQAINGKIPKLTNPENPENTIIDPMGVKEVLTAQQLQSKETYITTLGWDETNFVYEGIENGLMPKINSTYGTLLPGQEDHRIGFGALDITSVNTSITGGKNLVQIEVQHPEGVTLDNISFDYLTVKQEAKTAEPTKTTLQYSCTPTRALDSYAVTQLAYTENGVQKTMDIVARVDFGQVFYNDIKDVADWQRVMKEKGRNYENFRITGTIDFSLLGDEKPVTSVLANRVTGIEGVEIKNAIIVTDTKASAYTALFQQITGDIRNLTFRNMQIEGKQEYSAIIARFGGTMENMHFEDCTISGRVGGNANAIGCIGAANIAPLIKNITLKNITAVGNAYVGGFIGSSSRIYADNIAAENITISANSSYAGGIFGFMSDAQFSNLSVKTATVMTKDNWAGGIIGFTNGSVSLPTENPVRELKATNVYVVAERERAGGLGNINVVGTTNVAPAKDIFTKVEVTDSVIVSKTQNAGALSGWGNIYNGYSANNTVLAGQYAAGGTAGGGNYNTFENNLVIGMLSAAGGNTDSQVYSTVKNSYIYGSNSVSGISCKSIPTYSVAADNTISTVHDASFKDAITHVPNILLKATAVQEVNDFTNGCTPVPVTDPEVQNRRIGGIVGGWVSGYNSYSNTAINNIIGADTATEVGGIVGGIENTINGAGTTIYGCASLNNKIYGKSRVGGILGGGTYQSIAYCTVDSEITATGDYAGGIVGLAQTPFTTSSTEFPTKHNLSRSIFVGSVTGGDYVGGLIGRMEYPTVVPRQISNIVTGKIKGTGLHVTATLQNSMGITEQLRTAVYEYAVVNDQYAKKLGKPGNGVNLVTSEQLKTVDFYAKELGMIMQHPITGTACDASGLPVYMPYVGCNIIAPYQEGKDAAGNYYPVNDDSYDGGIPVPTDPEDIEAPPSEIMPSLDIYMADADVLNLEFSRANPNAKFEVFKKDKAQTKVFESTVTDRVMAMRYDFFTPLRVTVTLGDKIVDYDIDPKAVQRKMSIENEEWSVLLDKGFMSGRANRPGEAFYNLSHGKAVRYDGWLWHVNTNTNYVQRTGIYLIGEGEPLWTFRYADATGTHLVNTYKNFTAVDGVEQPGQIIVKANKLFKLPVSAPNPANDGVPDQDYVHDGFIADSDAGKDYLTVLGKDGALHDLQTPIVLPKDFLTTGYGNSNIVEISNNLSTNLPHLFVRYKNGTMVAFNYLTGEMLNLGLPNNPMTMLDYVFSFFTRQTNKVQNGDAYNDVVALKDQLVIEAPDGFGSEGMELPSNGAQQSENSALTDGAALQPGGAEITGSASVPGETQQTGSAANNGQALGSESASTQTPFEEQTFGQGTETTLPLPQPPEAGENAQQVPEPAPEPTPEPTQPPQNITAEGKAKTAQDNYVVVYNAAEKTYDLYETTELLSAKTPVPVSKKQAAKPLMEKLQKDTSQNNFGHILENAQLKGVVLYSSGTLLILLLLLALKLRKTKREEDGPR